MKERFLMYHKIAPQDFRLAIIFTALSILFDIIFLFIDPVPTILAIAGTIPFLCCVACLRKYLFNFNANRVIRLINIYIASIIFLIMLLGLPMLLPSLLPKTNPYYLYATDSNGELTIISYIVLLFVLFEFGVYILSGISLRKLKYDPSGLFYGLGTSILITLPIIILINLINIVVKNPKLETIQMILGEIPSVFILIIFVRAGNFKLGRSSTD